MDNSNKARPIIFNAEMVRALIAGRKTQTRRPVNPQPLAGQNWHGWVLSASDRKKEGCASWRNEGDFCGHYVRCPFGAVGDLLYVRETFGGPLIEEGTSPDYYYLPEFCEYRADGGPSPEWNDSDGEERSGWTPSIHMPRWASRITLEITSVRVERLNDISKEDASAEGFDDPAVDGMSWKLGARHNFKYTWDSIYKNADVNPWVWVIEFKPHMMNVDQFIRESSNDEAS